MNFHPGYSEPSFICVRELLSRIACDLFRVLRKQNQELKTLRFIIPKEFVFTVNDCYDQTIKIYKIKVFGIPLNGKMKGCNFVAGEETCI